MPADGGEGVARSSAVHVPALDGVRGLAIVLVLAHNFSLLDGATSIVARLVSLGLDAGWVGVGLFFVLSGFLITGILLDTREAENYWGAFLARRALRIFPLYYAVLFVAFVVAPLFGRVPLGAEHQLWLWTYLANFAPPVAIFSHVWSLSIEEQFYLLWPLFVRRLSRRGITAFSCALVGVAVVSRLALRQSSFGPEAAYVFTFARVDALALGALSAVALRDARARARIAKRRTALRGLALLVGLGTFVATRGAPRTGAATQMFGYTAFALVFAWFVLDAATALPREPLARVLAWRPLRSIGRYSYAMYIFHLPIHLLVGRWLLTRFAGGDLHPASLGIALAYEAFGLVVSYAAAAASYHLFEKRFLVWKARFRPRWSSP